jgi:putative hydrolase of the HAD superfamily
MDATSRHAVFFDLDGTLLSDSYLNEAVEGVCKQLADAHGLNAALLLSANAAAWSEYWPDAEPKWTIGAIDGHTVNTEVWRRTLLAVGMEDPALTEFATSAHRRLESQTERMYPDADAAFQATAGRATAIITNGASDTQRGKITRLGLDGRVDVVLISGELGIAKPDPAIFGNALAAVRASSAIHVGDSLVADIAGAQAAGLVAVWVNRTGRDRAPDESVPDHEIASLSELPSVLARYA